MNQSEKNTHVEEMKEEIDICDVMYELIPSIKKIVAIASSLIEMYQLYLDKPNPLIITDREVFYHLLDASIDYANESLKRIEEVLDNE